MDLQDYVGAFRRSWLLIVVATLLGGAVAFGVTSQITPQYTSTSGVFVSTTPRDASTAVAGAELAQQRAASYADVVEGLDLAQEVIDSLGLDETPQELASRVEATVVPETVVLRIEVTDPDRARAQQINQEVLTQLEAAVDRLETPPGADRPLLVVSVFDAPRAPQEASSPQPVLNVGLGLVVGLLVGLGLAVVRALRDFGVRSLDDTPALAELPLLGSIAYSSDVAAHPVMTDLPTHAPRAEAFRVLATNLAFADVDRTSTVLVVTSSVAAEGKSTTALNAAAALSASGKRVLLVDGDLRRPQIARLVGVEQAVGLTSVLLGAVSLPEAVQQHAASGVDVLASGRIPPNPVALLQSEAMQRLLEEARAAYDVVVVDAPPLLPVTDAALLSAQSDGAVLVLRHGETTRDEVTAAVARLTAVDARPVGVVFNMVRKRDRSGAADAYSYGYAPSAATLADDVGKRSAR
ncbi:tyrosine-protein kinase domain-containing protein [Nocardioides marmoraquaticus]